MADLGLLRTRLMEAGFGGHLLDDVATRAVYSTDNSIYQLRPAGVVVPTSTDDLVTLARVNQSLDRAFALVARGGGTGTNGQSLTREIVVDMRRSLNRILSIDAEAREAVVQPGVVLGQLNAELAADGLFFAPHASTSTRATIGGMVATDAAGKGSLIHGRTNKHVLGLTAVLADGTMLDVGPTDPASVEERAGVDDTVGALYHDLMGALDGLDVSDFPDVPRGFTGYNLAEVRRNDPAPMVDFTRLLCGSEGTLALLAEIRIRLTPLPSERHLAVLSYPTFTAAVRDANRLKEAGPSAIECLDERTIALAAASPAWPQMSALLNSGRPTEEPTEGGQASLLLLEFESREGLERLHSLSGTSRAMAVTSAPDVIEAVWKVRADAVGLLGQEVDGHRSVAFVEDCAVPPQHLEEFVAGFRHILDSHGLRYGMFGHADVGCVHVRPALDLYREDHEQLVRTVSDEVAELVASFGGVLWGEHGRGFRGEYLDLPDHLVERMRRIKTAFDPHNLLNPGKLYTPFDPGSPGAPDTSDDRDLVRIDEVALRVHHDRTVAPSQRVAFADAFSCNGNGVCHHWGQAEVMCPSYKATLDPRLSPKGRADLLRAWLADPDDDDLVAETADSMRQCLSCSACAGRCPLQVDIPEMKSKFLYVNPDRGRRARARDTLLSRFEMLLPVVSRAARPIGAVQRLVSPVLAAAAGVIDLPGVPASSVSPRWPRVDQRGRVAEGGVAPTVVVIPDAFTYYLEPEVMDAALTVLAAMGERPAIGPFVPSGKYDHVKGRRDRFARAVQRQRGMVEKLSAGGLKVLVLEPAVYLLHRHEYRAIDPDYPSALVGSVVDHVAANLDRLPGGIADPTAAVAGERRTVQLFQHCTEVSVAPETANGYGRILTHRGFSVVTERTSCCGMAGVFGHEIENQDMSQRLFDEHWRPRLLAAPAGETGARSYAARCAPGYSCRSQAKRLNGPRLIHPLVLVADELEQPSL